MSEVCYLYALPLLISAIISLWLVWVAWHRQVSGCCRTSFILLMSSVAAWLLTGVLHYLAPTQAGKTFWMYMEYAGVTLVPNAFLIFVLQYTGRQHWLTRRNLLLLSLHPLLTNLLVWTNPWHRLFHRELWLEEVGRYVMLAAERGPFFWVHAGYAYLLIFIATALLVRTYLNSSPLYRRQAAVLLAAALIPWVANILTIFRLVPIRHLDLTPFAFALTGLVMYLGLQRFNLLDLVPVARDVVVDNLEDMVIVLDMQDRVVDLNAAARRLLPPPAWEKIGHPVTKVFPEYADVITRYANVANAKDELPLGKGGRVYELRISPVYIPDFSLMGRHQHQVMQGRIITLHDITERQNMAAALRASEAALRAHAAELETRNAELDAFAITVAHDLKNPLTHLLTLSTYLEDEGAKLSESELMGHSRAIADNARKMNTIIEALLLLARVTKDEIELQPLDMQAIVAEVVEKRLARELAQADAELVTPETWPVSLGYEPLIEQVWVNYIINALKYGGQPLRIELGWDYTGELSSTTEPEEALPGIRFWVRDYGEGLTPEQQARLFVPFERLGKVHVKGTGLGLSIVRRIMENLGGKVGMTSSGIPGEGCTFYFILPAAPLEASRRQEASTRISS